MSGDAADFLCDGVGILNNPKNIAGKNVTICESLKIGKSAPLYMYQRTAPSNNYMKLLAPSTIASSFELTLPDSSGVSKQVLSTDGTGGLTWVDTSPTLYDAVVASDGTGDYLLLSAAIADGKKNIFIRAGVYFETVSIEITQNTTIRGESGRGVIIIFQGLVGVPAIKIGVNDPIYTTGTVSVASGSNLMTGVGTSFTNLNSGAIVMLEPQFFTVSSVTDDLNLVLKRTNVGSSITTSSYIAFNTAINYIQLSGFAVINSSSNPCTGNGIEMYQLNHDYIDHIAVVGFANNLDLSACAVNFLTECMSLGATIDGLVFDNCYQIFVSDVGVLNNTNNGITFTNKCHDIKLNKLQVVSNGNDGINIGGTSSDIVIHTCSIEHNIGFAVNISLNVTEILIGYCHIDNNTGVSVLGTLCNINDCVITNSTGNAISLQERCEVAGTLIENAAGHGITIASNSFINISSNLINGVTNDGIRITGTTNSLCISQNVLTSIGGSGINMQNNAGEKCVINGNSITTLGNGIDMRSDNNVISGNMLYGNAVTNKGIYVNNGNKNVINGNRVENFSVGIEINSTGPNGQDNLVNGNSLFDNTTPSITGHISNIFTNNLP